MTRASKTADVSRAERRALDLIESSALAGPIDMGTGLKVALRTRRGMWRHVVLIAVKHIRRHGIRPEQCTRELVHVLSRRVERSLRDLPNAKGVNVKQLQRDRLCDRLYSILKRRPARRPWPRDPNGAPMTETEVVTFIGFNRALAEAYRCRSAAMDCMTSDELRHLHAAMVAPMSLARRIARFAPPVAAGAVNEADADVVSAGADRVRLADLHEGALARLGRARAAWSASRVRWAVRLLDIHREHIGLV